MDERWLKKSALGLSGQLSETSNETGCTPWSPCVFIMLVECQQSVALLFPPQMCFPSGTPSLLTAKPSTHLPVSETLELSPSQLDAVTPQSPASHYHVPYLGPSSQPHLSSLGSHQLFLELATNLSSHLSSFLFFDSSKGCWGDLYKAHT